ncbi:5-(carboxyamino)imidazole ribonucleotide mutase [bacterium]|nr:5-(carboxyamino)imidazole ribonucleotide mutase [bacterium]
MPELNLPEELDVLVLLGSLSDEAVAAKMQPVFRDAGVRAHFEVCSAHRDHERLAQLIPAAEERGCRAFIGVAGMAAHLPGVIAALTVKPVIGVPCTGSLEGLDALMSVAQMPPGIPVACTALNGGLNAALLAIQILAVDRPELNDWLIEYRARQQLKNRAAGAQLRENLSAK